MWLSGVGGGGRDVWLAVSGDSKIAQYRNPPFSIEMYATNVTAIQEGTSYLIV